MKEMKSAGLGGQVPSVVRKKDWVVDSQAVGTADNSIRYLAPYVFRVAISNHRIVKVEDGYVTFKYAKHGSRQIKTTRLKIMEFIPRFLQHVLPSGFMKVRHYGFMNPNCGTLHKQIINLIEQGTGESLPKLKTKPIPSRYCSDCGGELTYLWSIMPQYFKRE